MSILDGQSETDMINPISIVDGHGKSLTEELEVQNFRLDSLITAQLPEGFILMKTSTFTVKNRAGLLRACQLRIYGSTRLSQPLDETSVVELLFPEHNTGCQRTIDYYDQTGWLFAERTIWHSPSMAVYAPYQAFPVKWLSRTHLLNPMHPQDFLVDLILDPTKC